MSTRYFKEDKVVYTYPGRKNETEFPEFVEICKKEQMELKSFLEDQLAEFYPEVVSGDGYLYAKGTDVLLTAHMDTVHKNTVIDYYEDFKEGKHIISSPQGIGGDDRCGVYMILEILKKTNYRPSILFCEDEEIGGVGSTKFCSTKNVKDLEDLKFFIELDRANNDDAVFYNDGNKEFQNWILSVTGYTEAVGSFSDISELCPEAGVSGVNLSCGYYGAHTLGEYVIVEEMQRTIKVVKKLLKKAKKLETGFEYEDSFETGFFGYGSEYNSYEIYGMEFKYRNKNFEECECFIEAPTENEAWARFFLENSSVCFNDVYDWETY